MGAKNLDMAQNRVINGDISKEKRRGVFMEGKELKGKVEEQINEGELRGSSGKGKGEQLEGFSKGRNINDVEGSIRGNQGVMMHLNLSRK